MATAAIMVPIIQGMAISAATAVISYLLTPAPPDQEGPGLEDLAVTASAYGKMRTITYGKISNSGNIFDVSEIYRQKHEEEIGGKGGKTSTLTTWTASLDFALGLGEGVVPYVYQIFLNEKLYYDINGTIVKPDWLDFTLYSGTETQQPDPTLQSIHGIADTPAYLGEAYIVFRRFQLEEFNNSMPTIRVVCSTHSDDNASEMVAPANIDWSTTTEAYLYSAKMHPKNRYVVHGWNWMGVIDNRKTPIGTVVDPNTNRVIFSLNLPEYISRQTSIRPFFGSLPDIEYGVSLQGDYDNLGLISFDHGGSSVNLFIWDSDMDSLEVVAILDNSSGSDIGSVDGSLYSNRIVMFSHRHTDLVTSLIRYWDVHIGGNISWTDVPLDMAGIGLSGWAVSNKQTANNYQGDVLLHGHNSNDSSRSVIVKWNFDSGLQWWIPVIDEFNPFSTGYTAVDRAVYDEITNIWWTSNSGIIWGINNSDGSTVDIWDISADPNFVNMDAHASFDPETRLLYWVAHNFPVGSGIDVPGSWDTVDRTTVLKYDVSSYESSSGLSNAYLTYYHHPTQSLFYSSGGSTSTDPSRKFKLSNLDNWQILLSDIVEDICYNCGLRPDQVDASDLSTTQVDGYRLSKLTTGRSNLAPLQHAYLFDVVDAGGVITFVKRGKASVATIPYDDLGVVPEGSKNIPAVRIDRIMESQLPASGNIIYLNADANYEPGFQPSTRIASRNTNKIKLTLPLVMSDTDAKKLINIILHLAHIEREYYTIKTMPKWQKLEGADVIDIEKNPEGDLLHARIINTSYVNGVMEIMASREESSVLTSYLTGSSAPPKDDSVDIAGAMIFALLDMPLLRDTDNNAGFYAAATSYNAGWPGGILFKSPDSSSWNVGSTFINSSIYGTSNSVLPSPANVWGWDRVNQIVIQMLSGDLFDVTEEQALQGSNSAVYGKHGRWEIINYTGLDEVTEGGFVVTGLLRGRLGTDHNIGNHEIGDIFIPLKSTNIEYVGNELAEIDVARIYRGTTLGVNLYAETNITKTFINTGVSLTPLSPQHIAGNHNDDLDLTISWRSRSRFPAANFWSAVPSETDDLYDIEIYLKNSTTSIHTVIDNPGKSYVWDRTQQIIDVDSELTSIIDIRVWHKSQRIGRGYEGFAQSFIGDNSDISFGSAVALVEPIMHFEFEEGYSPITDEASATDSMGNVLTAKYNVVINLVYAVTTSPSNLEYKSNDKSIYQNISSNADRLNIPAVEFVTSNNIFSASFTCNFDTDKANNWFVYAQNYFEIRLNVAGDYLLEFVVYGPGATTSTIVRSTGLTAGVDLDLRSNGNMFVVVTVDTNDLNIFINGVRDVEIIQDGALTAHNTPSGTFQVVPQKLRVDNFAFYDKVLSDIEIAYLYSNTGL